MSKVYFGNWYTVRVLGGEDYFGDSCEWGGWALYARTNSVEDARRIIAEVIAEFGRERVWVYFG